MSLVEIDDEELTDVGTVGQAVNLSFKIVIKPCLKDVLLSQA